MTSALRGFGVCLFLLMLGLPATATASTIWTFHDTTLTGSIWNPTTQTATPVEHTVTGWFEVGTAVNSITGWDVTVAGDYAPFNHNYKSGNSGNAVTWLSPTSFAFTYWTNNVYLSVELLTPLVETAGFAQIFLSNVNGYNAIGDGTYTCTGPCAVLTSQGYITANAPVTAPVPEPASLALLGSGLVGLAARRLRKK